MTRSTETPKVDPHGVTLAVDKFGVDSTIDIVWRSTAETAEILDLTVRTIYRLIESGQLPACRFGRVIRIKDCDIEAFIESCRIRPGDLG